MMINFLGNPLYVSLGGFEQPKPFSTLVARVRD